MADETRPTCFADYFGQADAKRELAIRIRAAQIGKTRLEHILLIAPPGTGKTSLAEIIGAELGEPTETLTCPVKERVLFDTLRSFDGCLVLDELQDGRAIHPLLLPLLKDGYISTSGGTKRLDVPWVTIIGTTTDAHKILPALYDRFHVKPELKEYTAEELALIVTSMGSKFGLDVPGEMAEALGRASLGSPRRARGLVIGYRDLRLANDDHEPTVDEVLQLCHTEADGLSSQHVEYLTLLDSLGGTRGVDLIARLMRVHEGVIQDLERVLIARGLVAVTDRGRELSKQGYKRVQEKQGAHDGRISRRT